jgi:hypothetical protein
MIALVFAAALVQMQPLASPEPAPSAVASAPAGAGIRRIMPYGAPPYGPDDAVIRNSGSTNIAGYVVVVHPDFSADVYSNGASEHKTASAPQAKWLFAKLGEAMPLGSLGVARCMKSASFGSSTTIAYRGQVTPDLSCGSSDATRELARTAAAIVQQLGVMPQNGMSRRRLL